MLATDVYLTLFVKIESSLVFCLIKSTKSHKWMVYVRSSLTCKRNVQFKTILFSSNNFQSRNVYEKMCCMRKKKHLKFDFLEIFLTDAGKIF